MREVELKAAVPHYEATLRRVEAAPSCELAFVGRIEDQRFDAPDRALARRDEVLRLRVMRPSADEEARMERMQDGALEMLRVFRQEEAQTRATLDWKGPTIYDGGYKVREELSTPVGDAWVFGQILARLGFMVTLEIDREARQYTLGGATLRFERYPRMDVLLEVEGTPEQIERAIAATGLPRESFTTDRLSDFVSRFEARTGERAALSDRALRGDPDAVPYSADDA